MIYAGETPVPSRNPKGKPQWTLENKTFLETGISRTNPKIPVLLPTGPNDAEYDTATTRTFAHECVRTMGEELKKHASNAAEQTVDFEPVFKIFEKIKDEDYVEEFKRLIKEATESA